LLIELPTWNGRFRPLLGSSGSDHNWNWPVTSAPRFVGPVQRSCCPGNELIIIKRKEIIMAKGEQKGNREVKKPKKDKVKTIAAAPSQKTAGWQPTIGTGKKK
jgi:hypothetical protein